MDDREFIMEKISSGAYTLTKRRKGKSSIWTVFAEIEKEDGSIVEGVVCCRSCQKFLKFNGKNSSNLNRHMCFQARATEQILKKVNEDDRQKAIDVCAALVVEDSQPCTAVGGSGFIKMVEFFIKIGAQYGENLDVRDLLPDATQISRKIEQTSQENRSEVKSEIQRVVYNDEASVTIDMWTDNYMRRNFLCAILHYQSNFELVDVFLGVKSVDIERSTESNILNKLLTLFGDFDIHDLDKIIFVTNTTSYLKNALRNFTRLNCSSHLFSTILDSAFDSTPHLAELINACKKIVKHFKKRNLQHTLQPSAKVHGRRTRWNSHFALFQTIVNNWFKINSTLADDGENQHLLDIKITTLQSLVDLCKDFDVIFKKLQSCSSPSLCFVLPSIMRVRSICAKTEVEFEAISMFKTNILAQIEDQWISNLSLWHQAAVFLYPPAICFQQKNLSEIKEFCINEISKQGNMATVSPPMPASVVTSTSDPLDPLIKLRRSSSPESQSSNSNSPLSPASIVNAGDSSCGPSTTFTTNNIPSPKEDVRFFFPELLRKSTISDPETQKEEIERYAKENVRLNEDFDVLQWWRSNSKNYPRLSKLALRIHSIPASSAGSELVFSLAKNMAEEKQNKLGPNTVDNVLFLNSYHKHFNK